MSKEKAQSDHKDRKTPPDGDRPANGHPWKAVIQRQHRSLDEIITANQVALDNLQNVWSRQCDMAMEAFRSLSVVIDESALAGHAVDPQIFEYAERSRQVFETSLAQTRELTDMTAVATKELVARAGRQVREFVETLHQTQGSGAH